MTEGKTEKKKPKNGHVILIDADTEAQQQAREALGSAEFEVHAYGDANRVLRVLEGKAYRRLFDWVPSVIIVDISLPKMSGYEFVRRCIQHSYAPKIPIIMITRYGSYEDEVEAYNVGACGMIQKPLSGDAVLRLIERYRDRQAKLRSQTLVFDSEPS